MSHGAGRLVADAPLPFDEARRLVLAEAAPLGEEPCVLAEGGGRVLSREVLAAHDVPPFPNSVVDGYALHAADTTGASEAAPRELRVVGEVAAGNSVPLPIGPGEAVRIMTGAPVPPDADGIVMLEWTEWEADVVRVFRPTEPGRFVRAAGEDVAAGARVAAAGEVLDPARIGVLASVGAARPWVHRRARVAILATGDELLEPEEPLTPGHIRSSNHLVLAGLARECGAEVVPLGIARDKPADLERRIGRAADCDVLLTSGGVSVGDHDLVQDALLAAGFRKIFWRVASSPGKPLLFGRLGRTLVFGLPGNPVSSAVAFGNFVRPALLRLHGRTDVRRPRVTAVAAEAISGPEDRRHFARVELTWGPDGWVAREVGPRGSGNLRSLVNANALAVLPEGKRSVAAGDPVEVILSGGILVRPQGDAGAVPQG